MTDGEVTKEEIQAVFPKVAETMAEALGCDVEQVSEIPVERFSNPMKVADIPRLFTPETFCKLVVRAQREAQPAS